MLPGERDDRGRIERIDAGDPDVRLGRRSPALPGATSTSFTPGSRPSFQASACSRPPPPTTRMRVGITRVIGATSRDQAVAAGRWRFGRHARSMVWVRSGPTETNTIGTPAWSSSADT